MKYDTRGTRDASVGIIGGFVTSQALASTLKLTHLPAWTLEGVRRNHVIANAVWQSHTLQSDNALFAITTLPS
jgi:hypothetical protein